MLDDVELLRRIYALFNRRDIEGVLAAMHPDVVWANGMEGGHVYGRHEVRSYWKRQWAIINPHVEPLEISPTGEGEVTIKVHQVVRDLKGDLLADRLAIHVFQLRDGLIRRFDIRATAARSGRAPPIPAILRASGSPQTRARPAASSPISTSSRSASQ